MASPYDALLAATGPDSSGSPYDALLQAAGQPQDRTSLARAVFPTATKPPTQVSGMPTQNFPGMTDPVGDPRAVMDLLSLPTRFAGSLAGKLGYKGATGGDKGFLQGMADTETGVMRPARESLGRTAAKAWQGNNGERSAADYAKLGAAGLGYLGASAIEDPTTWLGGVGAIGKAAPEAVANAIDKPLGKVASLAEKGANKIEHTIVRPRTIDALAGAKIENISKYGIGGSVDEVIGKSQDKITQAASNLRALIQSGKDQGARVSLVDAIDKVGADIAANKAKNTPILKEYQSVLNDFKDRAKLITPDGNADLLDAQYFKQGMGDIGAWEHVATSKRVSIPRDETVKSQLASRVYLQLKDAIEKAAPDGVKEQNQILSDLIPLNRAASYRKIVADRNNVVSLNDMLGMVGTIAGGPKGLAVWAAARASKSGNTAKMLYGVARAFNGARSPQEAAFYADKLQKLGITAAEIDALKGASQATNTIPFRQVAQQPQDNTLAGLKTP